MATNTKLKDNMILLTASPQPQDQSYVAAGKVTDPQGRPLAGVAVGIKGAAGSTVTDAMGRFSLRVTRRQTLTFTMLGSKTDPSPESQTMLSGLDPFKATLKGSENRFCLDEVSKKEK